MGCEEESSFFPLDKLQHQFHHRLSGLVVEVTSWFIGQYKSGTPQERSANRDPLHFTSTQFLGIIVSSIQQIDSVEKFLGSIRELRLSTTSDQLGKCDILPDRQVWKEVEELKDQTDMLSPKQGSISLR
jgi:hypothetical protein